MCACVRVCICVHVCVFVSQKFAKKLKKVSRIKNSCFWSHKHASTKMDTRREGGARAATRTIYAMSMIPQLHALEV